MDDLASLIIERECLRLMALYNHHIDAVDADAFVALFTEDAIWARAVPGPRLEVKGHDGLRALMGQLIGQSDRLRKHLLTNAVVTVTGPDEAEGLCTGLAVYGPAGDRTLPVGLGGIELVGDYRDVYRRTPKGWRIASRELTKVIDLETLPR
jgi:hypothetical protein